MGEPKTRWVVDEDDPRSPPQELWDEMTDEERAAVLAALPSEFPLNEAVPPEGDFHSDPIFEIRDTLRRYYGRSGGGTYVGTNLPVYYPGERMFSPDVIVVRDVDPHARQFWNTSAEGKGLDFAMEVIVAGRRKKDLVTNRERYARLGIPEFFVFEPLHRQLRGFRLPASGFGVYEPIVPQAGRYSSHVLGMDLMIMGGQLRFMLDESPLVTSWELNTRLNTLVGELVVQLEDEGRRAEEAERLLAEALEKLRRLEGEEPKS